MDKESFLTLLQNHDQGSWLKYGKPTGAAANRCTWNVRERVDCRRDPKIIYNVVFFRTEPVVRLELYTSPAMVERFENHLRTYPPVKGRWESERKEPGLIYEIEQNARTNEQVYDEIMQTLTAWHTQYNEFLRKC